MIQVLIEQVNAIAILTLNSPLKVIITPFVNSREACRLQALIFDVVYGSLILSPLLFTLDTIKSVIITLNIYSCLYQWCHILQHNLKLQWLCVWTSHRIVRTTPHIALDWKVQNCFLKLYDYLSLHFLDLYVHLLDCSIRVADSIRV